MNNEKKISLVASPTNTRSFTEILFVIYVFLFFTIGFLLLFFTETVSLVTLVGEQTKLTIVVEQFFGSFLLLLSFFLFSVRKLEGQVIVNFIFQIIMQISFFVVLLEQVKKK